MSYLRTFIPWIVFAAVTAFNWRWGAAVGAIAVIVDIACQLRLGNTLDGLILELSSLLFFVVLSVVAVADGDSPLRHWAAASSLAWLGVTAWFSLLVKRPFTLGIARKSTPRQFWRTQVFYRVNAMITAFWAASFTVIAAGTAIAKVNHAGIAVSVAIHFGYIAPIIFTSRYPKIVRARAVASAGR